MARKMRVLSPFLVIAIVLSLVAGVIAVSPQTALAAGETTLTVEIVSPGDGDPPISVCQYFWVNAKIYNTGNKAATGVSASLSVTPVTACSIQTTNPVTLTLPLPAGAWAGVGWTLHCEGAGDATITVDVTADNASAVTDSVNIKQVPPPEEEAHLVAEILSPVTSTTFSTCQNFDLVFAVGNTGEADALSVTATIDPGDTAEVDSLGAGVPSTVTIGTIPGGGTAGPFTVVMHCVEAGDSTITVTPAGTDENTGQPIPDGTVPPDYEDNIDEDSITVHQEAKAHLVVDITAPPDGKTYSTCQDFTVTATVTNTGEATALGVQATVDPGATASVTAGANPQGLGDIAGGGSAVATWTLHCDRVGDSTITVTPAGTDENTGQPIPDGTVPPDYEDNIDEDSVTVHQEEETPPPEELGTRTLGFYKNHPCVVAQVLPISIAGEEVTDVDRVIEILEGRKNHRSRLLSQLMATKLNVAVFGIGYCTLEELGLEGDETVNEVIAQAEELLADSGATKDQLSAMQDLLDRINNSNDDAPLPEEIAEACPPGKGKGKGK